MRAKAREVYSHGELPARRSGCEARRALQSSLPLDTKPKSKPLFGLCNAPDRKGWPFCLLCENGVNPLQRESHAKRHVRKGEAVEVKSPMGKTVSYEIVEKIEPPRHKDTKKGII